MARVVLRSNLRGRSSNGSLVASSVPSYPSIVLSSKSCGEGVQREADRGIHSSSRDQRSGHKHDLTASTTPREILIGLAYIRQMVNLGDRDLQATGVDQAGEFCKHRGIRRRAVALCLDAVFR